LQSTARRRARSLLIGACFVCSAAAAAPTKPQVIDELRLAQAVTLALEHNPDLAVAAYEVKAADARQVQSRLRRNPDLALDFEDFAGSGAYRGTDSMQSTLSLSQVIELGDKRGQRMSVAAANREMTGIDYQARALDVLGELTRRFVDVAAAQEQVKLAESALTLIQRTQEAIAARVKAARSPLADLSRARIALLRAELDLRQAQSVFASSRVQLSALWGDSTATFNGVQANLFDLTPLRPYDDLKAALERNPDFLRLASQTRLREAEWRLAQAQARPNLTVGIGVRRFAATHDTGLVAGFSVGLPLFDRNQGAVAEAAERRRQSQAENDAARIRAEATLYALYRQASISRETVERLRRNALPEARTALEQSQYAYDRGRFSYLDLAAAEQELLALKGAIIVAAADFHRLTADIERLTGEPLTATPPQPATDLRRNLP